MKILITQPSAGQMQKVIRLLKEKMEKGAQNITSGITVEIWDSARGQITCSDIEKSEADLFINFNLLGFGQSTLTDGIAYNLLNCKQLHILLNDKLPEEKYLAKQLSISMFLYCMDREYCRYLQKKYPDIPYLKAVEVWKRDEEENSTVNHAEALERVIREVIQLCGMLPSKSIV